MPEVLHQGTGWASPRLDRRNGVLQSTIRTADGKLDSEVLSALAVGGVAVMLIPARTDTKAFHEYIYGKAEIRFIKGRLRFGNAQQNAPFPSMIVIYRKEQE